MGIDYERRGAGEPLVLIHGLGGSKLIWIPVIDRLAVARDVIALDMPGFAGSGELAANVPPTAANLGIAISDFCSRLGLEHPHLAGNSLGAWVALEMAKAGRAASVCAISPAGLWPRPLGPRRYNARTIAHRLRPLLPLLLASARGRAALLQTIVARPQNLSASEARALVRDWLASTGYDAANEQMRADVFEHPERVRVPTTIAWCAEDRLVAAPRADRMPPQARYLVLEGCGHTPTWDDPEAVAELLLEASALAQPVCSGRFSPGQEPVAR